MRVSFCVLGDEGRARVQLLGARPARGLLTLCRKQGRAAVVLGRLQYRRDLAARLGLEGVESLDDAALALEAYLRRGADGLVNLEGVFALAVWDGPRRRLLALRDPLGGYPLFWSSRGACWGVGTSLPGLRRAFAANDLDPEYLADYLALPNFGQNEPRSEHTPVRGVRRLLPGHLLRVEAPTASVRAVPCWDWLERLEDPGTDRVEQIAEGYAARLRAAVRAALHGTTAAHLSGGMDSTSVSLLALEAVAAGAAAGPLHTISLVYDRMRVLSRERPLIEGLTRGRQAAVAHAIEGDGLLDFDCYAEPPPHDEPWPWLSAAGVERARVEAAAGVGADTVLTGQGADEMMDVGPYHLTDLLRQGRLGRAWAVATQAARAENCSVWSLLYPFGLINLLPVSAREGLGPLLRGGWTSWLGMGEDTLPPWVLPQFARAHHLRERCLAHTRETFFACKPTVLSVARSYVLNRAGDAGRWYLSTPAGMLVCHPFLDARVLRYSLGIHARIPPLPRGRPKPILAEAMRGVLPEEVRTRPKAGFFNEPCFRGVARHLGQLEALVRAAGVDDLGLIDKATLLSCLRQSALGIGNARIQLDRMNLTLSLLRWLTLEKERGAAEEAGEWFDCCAPAEAGAASRAGLCPWPA
jgi:asparagine synthase (glutamine-hydrolysing)